MNGNPLSARNDIEANLKRFSENLSTRCTIEPIRIVGPVSHEAVDRKQEQLGQSLPPGFVRFVTEVMQGIKFGWRLPSNVTFRDPFDEIFAGQIQFSFRDLLEVEQERRSWANNCFSDPDDPYDKVWHDVIGLLGCPNGDMIGLNVSDDTVVYLSHDDGALHGETLAPNIEQLMLNWSRLGFVGPESWQIAPFFERGTGINPDCDLAAAFVGILKSMDI